MNSPQAIPALDAGIFSRYISATNKAACEKANLKECKGNGTSLAFKSWILFSNPKKDDIESMKALDTDRSRQGVTGTNIFSSSPPWRTPKPSDEQLFVSAKRLIKRVWPAYGVILDALQPRMSLTDKNDTFESSSDPKLFGQILYRFDSHDRCKAAEIIVHETAHHYLYAHFAKFASEARSIKWDELYYSAIRGQDRPLVGILHGVFAQKQMLLFADKLKESGEISGSKMIQDRFQKRFVCDLDSLKSAKEFKSKRSIPFLTSIIPIIPELGTLIADIEN